MSDKVTYHVMREHLGDKYYVRGDTRELRPDEAAHLVRIGVLSETAPDSKAKGRPDSKGKGKA